ncbi:hypothetical protein K438DRAFT_1795031 [Mycena galopus ATCC 62051]|nr:hypothetical protein K438DRAFT_1795031 [Mycena galopus ATCC 62051]
MRRACLPHLTGYKALCISRLFFWFLRKCEQHRVLTNRALRWQKLTRFYVLGSHGMRQAGNCNFVGRQRTYASC